MSLFVTRIPLFSVAVFWMIGLTYFQATAAVVSISVPFISPQGIAQGDVSQKNYVTQQDRYHTFRIPGAIVTQDGSVLVFAEGRRGMGGDPRTNGNAPGDLVMRRSTDHGQTWEPLVVIDSGFLPNGDKVDYADPTPVSMRKPRRCFWSTDN